MTTVSNITSELKTQGLPVETINKLMIQMNNLIRCGPTCQRNNKIDELKKKYEAAQEEVHSAPERLNNARKNYFTFTHGDSYYQNFEKKKNLEKAKKLKSKIKKNANKHMAEIEYKIENTLFLKKSKKNLYKLLNKLRLSNEMLEKNMDRNVASVKTSDRKVFYENQEIETLFFYKNILKRFYWLLIVIYTFLFFYNKFYKNRGDIILFIIFFATPFIIDPAVRLFIRLIKHTVGQIPKNIYLNL